MIPLRDINPTERFPLVTVFLLWINILIYLVQLLSGGQAEEAMVASFGLVPAKLFEDAVTRGAVPAGMTLITSQFLHGGFFHIAGNMLYLWIFGNNVEDSMGRIRFTVFYLLCGVIAAVSHSLANTVSLVPMIGASGAISGILGAYLVLYPRARVITLMIFGLYLRTVEVPAMFVLGFWFILQFLSALVLPGTGGGVAWYAHVGGFIAGILLVGLFKRSNVPFGGGRSDHFL